VKILFVGQSRWCADLAHGITRFTEAQAETMPMDHARDALNLADIGKLRNADLIVRVGFRPGAHTPRGTAFDALLELARGSAGRVAYFWIGTDVADTVQQASATQDMARFRRLTKDAIHVAVSYQLRDELEPIGIQAEVAWMPPRHVNREAELPPFPEIFTVLTYVPDFRHEFYGGDVLLEAARQLPEMEFRVTAGAGNWVQCAPPNVHFLGHVVANMAEEFRNSSCLVRMVRHDGLSNMVIEALSYGRPVIYSARLPHTEYVEFGDVDSLEGALRRLAAQGETVPARKEADAAVWAVEISDEEECYRTLLRAFTGGAGRSEYAAARP